MNAANTSNTQDYGAGAYGGANAETVVQSNQNVTLGDNTALTAFGNIELTAGDGPTDLGVNNTTMIGNANAQAVAHGIVGIPSASATTALTTNATLTVNQGDQVSSGQNTTLAADNGVPNPKAMGLSHGFDQAQAKGSAKGNFLFIPISGGKSRPAPSPPRP